MDEDLKKEYLESLSIAFQYAEEIYKQAARDLETAEIRRDKAKAFRDDIHSRLVDAKEKYGSFDGVEQQQSSEPYVKRDVGKIHDESPSGKRRQSRKANGKTLTEGTAASGVNPESTPKTPVRFAPSKKVAPYIIESPVPLAPVSDQEHNASKPDSTLMEHQDEKVESKLAEDTTLTPRTSPSPLLNTSPQHEVPQADLVVLSPRKSIKAAIAETEGNSRRNIRSSSPNIPREDSNRARSQQILSTSSPQSPSQQTSKHGRLPRALSPRRKSSRPSPSSLMTFSSSKPTLEIAKGRSRQWYEKNFDCESCGLLKKFYKATFGTTTNEKSQKVTVRTIVLSDEWSDLVADTGKIQEIYVGKSSANGDAGPSLRDRAAHALVEPPQSEPIALFFATKMVRGTSEIYYAGHWQVLDGMIIDPPQMLDGIPRQSFTRLTFIGVDPQIVNAINRDEDR